MAFPSGARLPRAFRGQGSLGKEEVTKGRWAWKREGKELYEEGHEGFHTPCAVRTEEGKSAGPAQEAGPGGQGRSFPAGANMRKPPGSEGTTGTSRSGVREAPQRDGQSLGQPPTAPNSTPGNKVGDRRASPRGTPGPGHTSPQAVRGSREPYSETRTRQETEN